MFSLKASGCRLHASTSAPSLDPSSALFCPARWTDLLSHPVTVSCSQRVFAIPPTPGPRQTVTYIFIFLVLQMSGLVES